MQKENTHMTYYISLPEVPKRIGQTYARVYYAILRGVVKPKVYGKSRLLSHEQIEILRAYFNQKDNGTAA